MKQLLDAGVLLNLSVDTVPLTAAAAEQVDTVVVDGRILKRNGRLTNVDTRQVVREAQQSLDALLKRAG